MILLLGSALMPVAYERGSVSAISTTFSTPIKVNDNTNEYTAQANPVGTILPNGKMFVAWRDERSGKKDVYCSVSNENINSFMANKKVNTRSSDFQNYLFPDIAFCKNNVYLVWEENYYSTFNHHIMFAKSTDSGNTFGPNIRVDDMPLNVNSQERPSIAVADDGTVIVAWINRIDNSTTSRIRLAVYDAANNTFSRNFELPNYYSSTSRQTSVSLATNRDYVFVAYLDDWSGLPHPYVTWSSDSCKSFMPKKPVRLDMSSNPNAYQQELAIASYPKGSIIAAWMDNRNGDWDIYGAVMHRYRDIWGENFRIDDGPSGTYQKSPAIVMDKNNGIYVAWSDDRYSDATDITWGVRFSYGRCDALPITFSASVSVYTPGRGEEQYSPSISVDGTNKAYITYSRMDPKATQPDVYMSAGTVSSTSSTGFVASTSLASLLVATTLAVLSINGVANDREVSKVLQKTIARASERLVTPCRPP